MAMIVDYSVVINKLPYLLQGAAVTFYISVLSLILGLVCGILLALMRDAKNPALSKFAFVYIWIFRGTPLLVQLFILYFGLPSLGMSLSSFQAAVLGLGLNTAAYVAEIIRSGIQAVDPGQREAAKALGMSWGLEMRRIVAPQAAKICLLPMVNQFVATLKNSSIVSLVTVAELMRVGDQIIATSFNAFSVYTSIALMYLIMTSVFMVLSNVLKRKLV
ncbi:MAG: amino acid ABC transporter permease [Oscillospiraceae bacterium]|jgi:His/Glu/Gln/Arg/opine family amino acid ABC transporter permease subunit|nr:amino acid ABC transporter permease [Oscillospiraceae bacterium]MCI1990491.1 amino acid ABC transporter permease [Oscillospiraceae bacterium]